MNMIESFIGRSTTHMTCRPEDLFSRVFLWCPYLDIRVIRSLLYTEGTIHVLQTVGLQVNASEKQWISQIGGLKVKL